MKKLNMYFMPIVRKNCQCGNKGQVYSWGEYHNAKWRTIKHFCQNCYVSAVKSELHSHMFKYDCEIELRARSGYRLAEFIEL